MTYRLYLAPVLPMIKRDRHGDPIAGGKLHLLIDVNKGEGFHDCHFPQSNRMLSFCWAAPETHAAIGSDPDVVPLSPVFASEAEYDVWLAGNADVSDGVVRLLSILGVRLESTRSAGVLAQLRRESFVEQRASNHLREKSVIEIQKDLHFFGRRV